MQWRPAGRRHPPLCCSTASAVWVPATAGSPPPLCSAGLLGTVALPALARGAWQYACTDGPGDPCCADGCRQRQVNGCLNSCLPNALAWKQVPHHAGYAWGWCSSPPCWASCPPWGLLGPLRLQAHRQWASGSGGSPQRGQRTKPTNPQACTHQVPRPMPRSRSTRRAGRRGQGCAQGSAWPSVCLSSQTKGFARSRIPRRGVRASGGRATASPASLAHRASTALGFHDASAHIQPVHTTFV